jgi:hypothetical protein
VHRALPGVAQHDQAAQVPRTADHRHGSQHRALRPITDPVPQNIGVSASLDGAASRRRTAGERVAVALLTVVGLLLAGCTRSVDGEPAAAPPVLDQGPRATVQGGTGSPDDRLAADLVVGTEGFWRDAFPRDFRRPWINIHGYFAVDPKDPHATVPCVRQTPDLRDQALYCPERDIMAWDRVTLIPRLVNSYGPGAVLVALAHEMGHAVQNRIGIDATTQVIEKEQYPTILLEGMADCFAGSVMRAAVDGRLPKVSLSVAERDRGLRALLSLRDPISLGRVLPDKAHGDGFDRASAFTDGYLNGPTTCAAMTVQNQVFTQRGYSSFSDEVAGGNLPLDDLVRFLSDNAGAWFGQLVTSRGHHWQAPSLQVDGDRGCAGANTARQGPAAFCPSSNTLSMSATQLRVEHDSIGDYASGAVVVSRYALAALAAVGRPLRGPDAAHTALCLTGAYTRAVFDGKTGFGLSPGDIDEAVDELLDHDFAARDITGTAPAGDLGFDRIQQFRTGVLKGSDGCGL